MAQDVGEELVWDFQEKDGLDRRSRSKKTKKDSDWEAEKVAWEKEKEEEECKWKKKKKREKEVKERKEKEEQEAKRWAEEEQLASNKRSARAKLIHTARLEKYDEELPEQKGTGRSSSPTSSGPPSTSTATSITSSRSWRTNLSILTGMLY